MNINLTLVSADGFQIPVLRQAGRALAVTPSERSYYQVQNYCQFSYLYEMGTPDINITIIEGYFRLLENLSPSNKLDLISKLTDSIRLDLTEKKSSFKKAFGAFQSEKDADHIIDEIHDSRTFTRQIEDI